MTLPGLWINQPTRKPKTSDSLQNTLKRETKQKANIRTAHNFHFNPPHPFYLMKHTVTLCIYPVAFVLISIIHRDHFYQLTCSTAVIGAVTVYMWDKVGKVSPHTLRRSRPAKPSPNHFESKGSPATQLLAKIKGRTVNGKPNWGKRYKIIRFLSISATIWTVHENIKHQRL